MRLKEIAAMERTIQFPFRPNMEDCKLVVESEHGTCYVFDTCCRDFTQEDKKQADRKILSLYRSAAMGKA